MRMPIWAILFIFLGSINVLMAQRATTYHQTFPLSESISSVIVDISYPFQVEKWPGNAIMVETNVKMKNISRQTMDFFIDQGRFDVVSIDNLNQLKLEMKPMVRKTITTRQGDCKEDIFFKVYIPESIAISTAGRQTIVMK